MDAPEPIKCSSCSKKFFADGFATSRLGKRYKTCIECSARGKRVRAMIRVDRGLPVLGTTQTCEHGRRRYQCVPCGGSATCEHGRQRLACGDCEPARALAGLIGIKVSGALKRGSRSTKVIEHVGCDIVTFRAHIESLWAPGMTWDNYGRDTWHIDHIVPLMFPGADGGRPTMEEVIERLHWSNTQPLSAAANHAKGKRHDGRRELTDAEIDELLEG